MKILFVNHLDIVGVFKINNGTLILATNLKKAGYDVDILDVNFLYHIKNISIEEIHRDHFRYIIDYIENTRPNIIGLSTMCDSYLESIALAEEIKRVYPAVKIIMGGPQATLVAEETLKNIEFIDAIGLGECDNTIVSLVQALENGSALNEVRGIAFRQSNQVIKTHECLPVEALDELPLMDYSIVQEWLPHVHSLYIDVGRGCPFGCTFCATKTFFKRKFRMKSPDRIIEDIKHAQSFFTNKEIYFQLEHDLFTANKKKVIEICNKIMEENLNIRFTISSRLDMLDEEIIQRLSKAGCIDVFIGIEVGSERMQKRINKNLKLDKLPEILTLLKKYGMRYTASFIYGFPDETEDDFRQTLKAYLTVLKSDTENNCEPIIGALTFLPGTEIFDEYKEALIYNEESYGLSGAGLFMQEKYLDLVKANKVMFAPYFYYKNCSNPHSEYFFLYDMFVNRLLKIEFPSTYKLLLEEYHDELFDMFMDFKNENPAFHRHLMKRDIRIVKEPFNKDFSLEILKMLDRFMLKLDSKQYKEIIYNLYEYEKQIYLTSYTKESAYKNFDIDVVNVAENNLNLMEEVNLNFEYNKPYKLYFTIEDEELAIFEC